MKKYLLGVYKKLIIVVLLYLLSLPIFVIETDYEITAPGMFNLVEEQITVNNDFTSVNKFYTTSVFVNTNASAFQVMISSLSKKNEVEKISYSYSHLSNVDYYYQGKISKLTSVNNSIIAAYLEANKIDSDITIDYNFIGYYIYYTAKDLDSSILRISDIIIGAKKTSDLEYLEGLDNIYQVLIENLNVDLEILRLKDSLYGYTLSDKTFMNLENFEKVNVNLNREDRSLETGISVMECFEIKSSTPGFIQYESNSSGNSGGLMQTISLYYNLIKKEFPSNLDIAGTGTIDLNFENGLYVSSSVGAIGGIVQKIYTADINSGIDIFFCPTGERGTSEYQNFLEAERTYLSLKNPNFKLVEVKSLADAINYLEGLL